jgi:hypothetical protein
MYALSSLQHILRRPAFCLQLPLLSHRHSPKLVGLFRPSLPNRAPCSFDGVVGQNGACCLIVSHNTSTVLAERKIRSQYRDLAWRLGHAKG